MELGPIYRVELIESLPIGGMMQAMPSRSDLELSRKHGDRVAAGYEVLLAWYRKQEIELAQIRVALDESLKLQSHYAELLNMHDGGQRMTFDSAKWIERLKDLGDLPL